MWGRSSGRWPGGSRVFVGLGFGDGALGVGLEGAGQYLDSWVLGCSFGSPDLSKDLPWTELMGL